MTSMWKRRKVGKRDSDHAPLIENPASFPKHVFIPGPTEMEAQARGLAYFNALKEAGANVDICRGPEVVTSVRTPATVIFMNVPWEDAEAWLMDVKNSGVPVVVILDCHFPVTRPHDAIIGDGFTIADVIDRIPTIMANLALADAVTVPRGDWAADLVAAVPNLPVYILPDLVVSRKRPEPMIRWAVRYMEIVNATIASNNRLGWHLRTAEQRGDEQ